MGKISNYASALKAKLTDFFVIASDNNGVLETKKVTTEQIGDAIASDQTHSLLDTSDKTLIGGINEVNSNVGSLSSLTTSDKSSLVGAVNELDSDKLDKSTYTEKTSVTINSLVATGAVYTKKIGNMVMVWGLVTTTENITTGTAILTGMYMNNNGANNVVKFIDNNGTSPDWVLYTPNANNVLLSASAQSSGHSFTVSFIYYSA